MASHRTPKPSAPAMGRFAAFAPWRKKLRAESSCLAEGGCYSARMKRSDEVNRLMAEGEQLRRENQRLQDELAEAQILLQNTIEHSEAIDEQLSDRNAALDKE